MCHYIYMCINKTTIQNYIKLYSFDSTLMIFIFYDIILYMTYAQTIPRNIFLIVK